MMQYVILLAFFATAFAQSGLRGATDTSVSVDHVFEWKEFTNFQERFSKRYINIQEFETRFQIFRTNIRNIILHKFYLLKKKIVLNFL